MINLLPKSEKKLLARERLLRFSLVALLLLFILECFTVLLFIPAIYTLHTTTADLTATLADREKLARTPEGGGDVEKSLAPIKAQIAILKPATGISDVPPSSLLNEIIAKKPAGITFKQVSYTRSDKSASFVFTGVAETQQDLLTFQRNMKGGARPVDFKYANSFITKKIDIDFSVSINFQ